MSRPILGPHAADFLWATGIEDTFVPQTRAGHRALDEYDLIGHYEHWRENLALVRDVDCRAVRWGVPWYRVEPLPGEFDWRWTDQVIPYLVDELGILPIIDLMHYGCPFWLRREFAAPQYPQAVAAYAAAFARRYGRWVRYYTPLNEPQINALLCGRLGQWPPYLRGDRGFVRISLQLVQGILQTVDAIRAVDPQAVMVHVDAAGLVRTAHPHLVGLAAEEQLRGYLHYDLLTGRVTPDHPLYSWLLRSGASPIELAAIAAHPITLDVLGLNFYPQWSTRLLGSDAQGRLTWGLTEHEGAGFAMLLREYYARYRVPIVITETSAHGSDAERLAWLHSSLAAIKAVRAIGVPVLGYTWFPLCTMIDWRYRFGQDPLDRYRLELGLYRLGDPPTPRWTASPLVAPFRACLAQPESVVGPLGSANITWPSKQSD